MSLKWRALLALLLCQGLGFWAAGACDPATGRRLEIEGLGTAIVGSFQADTAQARLELSNGVCIESEQGWQLEAPSLTLVSLGEQVSLSAEQVVLFLNGWEFGAQQLVSEGSELRLSPLRFSGFGTSGEAAHARFDIRSGDLDLERVEVKSRRFRVTGDAAQLRGERLIFYGASATTCVCGEAGYLVNSPEASFDLTRDELILREGVLQLGLLELPLGEQLRLSPEALAELSFPVTIDFIPDNPQEGIEGTGLGILVPSLPLTNHMQLELGFTGIDRAYPFRGVALLHYDDGQNSFDIGLGKRGPQADSLLKAPLAPWLTLDFAVRNHIWQAADFLHEGRLGLEAQRSYRPWQGGHLQLSAAMFAAGSAQTLEDVQVSGARLGGNGQLELRHRTGPWRFQAALSPQLTAYPAGAVYASGKPTQAYESIQYGLRFNPRVRVQMDGFSAELAFERQWTNAASPFGESLDRLEPKSRLSASFDLNRAISAAWSAELAAQLSYSFLPSDDLAPSLQGFETFKPSLGLSYQHQNFSVETALTADLAPLLTPQSDKAKLEAALSLGSSAFQLGLSSELALPGFALERFETSVEFPVRLAETVLVQPFVALDWLPLGENGEPPRVSGYGLGLSWETCCGTLRASFRQRNTSFTTTFALEL